MFLCLTTHEEEEDEEEEKSPVFSLSFYYVPVFDTQQRLRQKLRPVSKGL